MSDVSKPKKTLRYTERFKNSDYVLRGNLQGAINFLGEIEDTIANGGALLTPEENQCWEKSVSELIEKAIKNYKQLLKEKYGIEAPDNDGQLTDQGGKQ